MICTQEVSFKSSRSQTEWQSDSCCSELVTSQKKGGTKSAPTLQVSPGKTAVQGFPQHEKEKYKILLRGFTISEDKKGALYPILELIP